MRGEWATWRNGLTADDCERVVRDAPGAVDGGAVVDRDRQGRVARLGPEQRLELARLDQRQVHARVPGVPVTGAAVPADESTPSV